MKFTHALCGAVLLSGAFFTSCKKNSNDAPVNPVSSDSAYITYKVTSTNRDSGLIHFTTVRGAGKQVAFKGNSSTSGRVELYKYNFQPSDFMTDSFALTTLAVPNGAYQNAEFNYQLIPSRDPALMLAGTWTANGASVPVEINIDNFVEVSTMLPTATLQAGHNYSALLNLDLQALQAGIYPGDLTSATRTNGKIVIAYYSNPALLQVLINNINNVMHHQVTLR